MKKLFLILFILAANVQAGVATFQYEKSTGSTKQCVYKYLGSEYTVTVRFTKLCPLTIKV